ncbi:MAG: ferredoxin-NADP reductase [Nitrospirae bacterium GWC2_57_13]|jgi:ferredoxin/flavodoxin---NADP+ reductase|nr:MAG: ferredoxin-NADP reductase [Nitrospirae bacterium GWC1_57_7]OGW29311.1 MAG: ferredoxin-NADP reductase [Nitrospirae bacterium GWC2_57_13]OGW43716.1 MAG: ferredoxin-NADP reductase [Nitrospirae bacterium GWD2_57_8]HAS55011.1 sulfide/dihydroorotate dehydrogenase-like FAD/NAD-binding protein [Nitrospiraceae bacterium]
MPKILEKKMLRKPDVLYFKVAAPLISKKALPGQFVILRLHAKGERIPLSLADIDPADGAISLVVMAVGKTTKEMSLMEPGDEILDLCGPLGNPTHIEQVGKVILVGGGFGVAPLYPIARAFRAAGNKVVCAMGARSRDLLVYEKEMESVCSRVLVATDDGSKGMKGLVTQALHGELEQGGTGLVVAVGPTAMMRAVSDTTRSFGVKTVVSLNPIMVDGTGMCGGCRVSVGGRTFFACIDGPEFDGHLVDWDILSARQRTYTAEQQESFDTWKHRHAGLLCE